MKSTTAKKFIDFFRSGNGLIIVVFALAGLIGILNHAMWRDEVNTWLIVRDSSSLKEIVGNVNYQGHPLLWALLLTVLKNIYNDPIMMKLLHLTIGISAISVFVLFSPFTRLQKILFVFGYIPFYQYLLICRNYSLGMLFLFLFCAAFQSRKRSYLLLSIFIALMANSNAYALLISFGCFVMLVAEFISDREHREIYFRRSFNFDWLLGLLIALSGFGLSIAILSPPADSTNHGGVDAWFFQFSIRRILEAMGRLFAGYTLIVPNGDRWLDLIACAVIAAIVFLLMVLYLRKKPLAQLFYVVTTAAILAFTYFRFMGGGPRHYGHFWLIFVASVWLSRQLSEKHIFERLFPQFKDRRHWVDKGANYVFIAFLWFQFLAGVLYAYPRDLLIPFSAGRETAQYIVSNNLDGELIAGSRDTNMAPISAYLGQKLYYPDLKDMGSFTLFRDNREELSHSEILAHLDTEILPDTERVLLILHKELSADTESGLNIEEIEQFERSWTSTERYYLYWVSRE